MIPARRTCINATAVRGRTFAAERANPDANVFDAVVAHIRRIQADNRRVILACWTTGARERLVTLLADHGLKDTGEGRELRRRAGDAGRTDRIRACSASRKASRRRSFAVIAEQDILGDRLVRQRRRASKPRPTFSTEATSLSVGDLVVHSDHGIGRFAGLQTITALGAPHDCLELHYAGGDKLFLPVENIELLRVTARTRAARSSIASAAWPGRRARRS